MNEDRDIIIKELFAVQKMWSDPELRNAVRLSQLALLKRLKENGYQIIKKENNGNPDS